MSKQTINKEEFLDALREKIRDCVTTGRTIKVKTKGTGMNKKSYAQISTTQECDIVPLTRDEIIARREAVQKAKEKRKKEADKRFERDKQRKDKERAKQKVIRPDKSS